MSKSKIDASSRKAHGKNNTSTSAHGSAGFFNQSHPPASSTPHPQERTHAMQTRARAPVTHPPRQEIRLTTTELLLAAILEELKMRNHIELMKINTAEEKEQAELQAAKEMEEQDKAHFEKEIRSTMFM